MRKWPDGLPTPSYPGWGLAPVDQVIRTEMEVGAPRSRRRSFAEADRVRMMWKMSDVEFTAFRAWHRDLAWSLAGDSESLAGWTLSGMTRLAGAALSPDLAAVDVLTENTATVGHYGQVALPSVVAADTVLVRATVRTAGRDWVRLSYFGWDGTQRYTDYDTASMVWGASSGMLSRVVESRGNGWQRLTMTAAAGTGAVMPAMRVQTLNAGASSYAGDGASTLSIAEVGARMVTGADLHLRTDAAGKALGAAGGAAWVLMPIPTGAGGLQYLEAQFIGPFDAVAGAALEWTVTATMEVRHA